MVNKHGGTTDDKRVYDMQVRELLHSESVETFERKYLSMKQKWSEAFVTYFDQNLLEPIKKNAGRWILEPLGMYNSYSGVTNNVVESLNAKLKRLVEYKEKRIDEIVLYLHYLQGNDLLEIIKAFCGESEWSLLSNFHYAKRDPETVMLP